ncbi:MAG: PorV/PorQ family protein [Melioribacteraceae bacterium]|nr:PorV/PorQ family protein [Melioribacteraceae bacterium]MCF8356532.1 PorV/PorQ family protein [Melioribacteraceae bacterium]MCF8393270.1 PorV/PorQ family protein [Melioribacteraceae bacterium]MCF8417571.1 PorV/PorQ family protein [Melioribacteraceae bacterium]
MKTIYYISIVLIILAAEIYPQVFAGSTSGQFLKIEPGARAIGMGGAYVSIADDASTIYWNPSGMSRLQNNSVTFSHTSWLAETSHNFAGIVLKLSENHALGLSYTSLTMPDMEVRTEFYQDGTGEYFSAADYSLGLSYAFLITEQFSIGLTGKYVGQSIWHMNASTIAFDVGIFYQTPFQGLNLGMCISNIGGKMKYEGEDNFVYYDYEPDEHGTSDKIFADIKMDEWDLPITFRVGLSYNLFKTDNHSFLISADALHPNDYGESVNTGFEYGFHERFFLRAGYKSLFKLESEEGLTAGAGLLYYLTYSVPMKVDYAFADFGRLNSVHRFSIEIGF